MAGTTGISIITRYATTDGYAMMNMVSELPAVITSSAGMFISSRQTSTNIEFYKNGVSLANGTTYGSYALPNVNIYIGARNKNGVREGLTHRQYSIAFISAGVSDSQARKITNCFEWYMDKKGNGVIP